jgi:AcrR family transcriptional regulator
MDTKNQILTVALNLFSEKGFDGISVRDIAKEVGVRESALYKHFKNKQEILDKIAEKMSEEVHEVYKNVQAPEALGGDIAKGYKIISEKKLCEMVWNVFKTFTGESELAKFRRLLFHEKNNGKFAEYYKAFFLDGVVNSQTEIFSKLIKARLFKKYDAEIMAMQFYSPVLFLFQKSDCGNSSEEEIKKMLFDHIHTFGKLYGKDEK